MQIARQLLLGIVIAAGLGCSVVSAQTTTIPTTDMLAANQALLANRYRVESIGLITVNGHPANDRRSNK